MKHPRLRMGHKTNDWYLYKRKEREVWTQIPSMVRDTETYMVECHKKMGTEIRAVQSGTKNYHKPSEANILV